MTTHHAAALALRTAAAALERARSLVQDLPAGLVGADEAMALYLDAPRLIQALANVAGSLDRAGVTIPDDEPVGQLGAVALPLWPRVGDPADDELVGELPADVQAYLDRRPGQR